MKLKEVRQCYKNGLKVMVIVDPNDNYAWYAFNPAALKAQNVIHNKERYIVDEEGVLLCISLECADHEPLKIARVYKETGYDGEKIDFVILEWTSDIYIIIEPRELSIAICKFCGHNEIKDVCLNCGCNSEMPIEERKSECSRQ